MSEGLCPVSLSVFMIVTKGKLYLDFECSFCCHLFVIVTVMGEVIPTSVSKHICKILRSINQLNYIQAFVCLVYFYNNII